MQEGKCRKVHVVKVDGRKGTCSKGTHSKGTCSKGTCSKVTCSKGTWNVLYENGSCGFHFIT